MEAYVFVQLGSFQWSEEYLGLTENEVVFVKPPRYVLSISRDIRDMADMAISLYRSHLSQC